MKSWKTWPNAILALSVALAGAARGVEIDINRAERYQTIEGFGFFPNISPWKASQGPFQIDIDLDSLGFYDTLISDLGATMIRSDMEAAFQADSGVWDYSVLQGAHGWFNRFRKLRDAAQRHNEPIRFIGHVWGPPGWMKVNGSANCGGDPTTDPDYEATDCRLKEGYDEELAAHLVQYVKTMSDSTGVDYYAISMQNEPAYQWPWVSCVYSPERYVSVFKVVTEAFEQQGLDTRFFGAELMANVFPSPFEAAIRADAEALSQMDIWALHGYSDGVGTDTGSFGSLAVEGRPLWMSSTGGSGYGSGLNDWNGAMVLARNILTFLRDDKGSAWTWWSLLNKESGEPAAEYALMVRDQPTAKYYASKHFYRYIRPGARQIASTSDDSDVRVAAFYHEGSDCLTLVLINSAETAKTVSTVSDTDGATTFERIVSTQTDKCVVDNVSGSGSFELPAASVTTLVAGTYRGTGTEVTPRGRKRAAYAATGTRYQRGRVRMYTLSGRLVSTTRSTLRCEAPASHTAAMAPGIYHVVTEDRHGNTVSARPLIRVGTRAGGE